MLALRYAERPDPRLEGAVDEDRLILLGPTEALPWAEGVIYLGKPDDAPQLRVPTGLRMAFPDALFGAAVRRADAQGLPPWLVFGSPLRVVSLAAAGPLDPDRLRAWVDR